MFRPSFLGHHQVVCLIQGHYTICDIKSLVFNEISFSSIKKKLLRRFAGRTEEKNKEYLSQGRHIRTKIWNRTLQNGKQDIRLVFRGVVWWRNSTCVTEVILKPIKEDLYLIRSYMKYIALNRGLKERQCPYVNSSRWLCSKLRTALSVFSWTLPRSPMKTSL